MKFCKAQNLLLLVKYVIQRRFAHLSSYTSFIQRHMKLYFLEVHRKPCDPCSGGAAPPVQVHTGHGSQCWCHVLESRVCKSPTMTPSSWLFEVLSCLSQWIWMLIPLCDYNESRQLSPVVPSITSSWQQHKCLFFACLSLPGWEWSIPCGLCIQETRVGKARRAKKL